MSALKLRLRFTTDADNDIADILLHTQHMWGVGQRHAYQQVLGRAFRRLVSFPGLGLSRDELFFGCQSLQVDQHVVYFHQLSPGEIVVVRVLHLRRDAERLVVLPESFS